MPSAHKTNAYTESYTVCMVYLNSDINFIVLLYEYVYESYGLKMNSP